MIMMMMMVFCCDSCVGSAREKVGGGGDCVDSMSTFRAVSFFFLTWFGKSMEKYDGVVEKSRDIRKLPATNSLPEK